MAGRVADGGLGEEIVGRGGRRRVRMDGPGGRPRYRDVGGAIVLAGSRALTRRQSNDPYVPAAVRRARIAEAGAEIARGDQGAYARMSLLQRVGLERQARRTGVDVRTMRRQLESGEVRPRGRELQTFFRTQNQGRVRP